MARAPSRRILSFAIGLAISGLLAWTLRKLDVAALAQALRTVSPASVALLLAASLSATVLQGLRLRQFLPQAGSALRHIGVAVALATGNVLLPFRGGELVRIFYLKKGHDELKWRTIAGWTIVDRVVEVICFVPFVLLACHVFASDPRFASLSRIAWPVGVASVIVLGAICLQQLRRATRESGGLGPIGRALAASLGVWSCHYVVFWCVVPDPWLALALLVAVNAALVVPGLPGNVGTYEAAFVWVGKLGGLTAERALAAAVVSHGLQIALTLVVGVPLLTAWGWPRSAAADELRVSGSAAQ